MAATSPPYSVQSNREHWKRIFCTSAMLSANQDSMSLNAGGGLLVCSMQSIFVQQIMGKVVQFLLSASWTIWMPC
jgi:hypothetical protein